MLNLPIDDTLIKILCYFIIALPLHFWPITCWHYHHSLGDTKLPLGDFTMSYFMHWTLVVSMTRGLPKFSSLEKGAILDVKKDPSTLEFSLYFARLLVGYVSWYPCFRWRTSTTLCARIYPMTTTEPINYLGRKFLRQKDGGEKGGGLALRKS